MKPLKIISKASAPAKVILFGEHFVVYGKPAVAAAINKRIYTEVSVRNDNRLILTIGNIHDSIDINSIEGMSINKPRDTALIFSIVYNTLSELNSRIGLDINIIAEAPFGSGLGTSAATGASLVTSIYNLFGLFNKYEIFRIVLDAERMVHENPSGVDPAISINGGLIMFRKGHTPDTLMIPLKYDESLTLIIVYSGEKRVTGDIVRSVKSIKEKNPILFDTFASKSEEITLNAVEALQNRDYATLGSLMIKNHELLNRLGVSSEILNRLVDLAINNGALGAKLTGAGGGGSIVVLASDEYRDRLLDLFRDYQAFVTNIEREGVRIE